mgnify:CR=1 FL=1
MATYTQTAKALQDVEVKVMMAFGQAGSIDDATATMAAVYSTAKQSFRLRVAELGGTGEDVDRAMQSLERFFLEHPESL